MPTDTQQQKFTFLIKLMDQEYTISAASRTKAVTEALTRFRRSFPESKVPLTVLRTLVDTSIVSSKVKRVMNRETVERLFSEDTVCK